ncbi:uncharacterized protein [Porites lutea]|uniref:uncharacterized protein isoform X4 n=1 Tax=Porites lutea TaxID=51062 RepID=UPI003CC585E7
MELGINTINKTLKIITRPHLLTVSIVTAWLCLLFNIALRIYYLWMRITTWFLNCVLSLILIWLFGLHNVSITIGEFGFLSVKGVKIRWRRDDVGLSIEEVGIKRLEWNFEKVRDFTLLFNIKQLKRELFTDFKDATTDIYTSFILHWKMQSPVDLLSSDLRNSSETIPKSFTLLKATDVEIGSRLHIHRGGSYVTLLEAAVLDGLLIPSEKVTSLYIKAKDLTYCSGPYDAKLSQARREKIIKLPLFDFLSTFYVDGPSRITITCHEAQMFLCPSKINSSLIFLNHLLRQQIKPDLKADALARTNIKINMEKFLELNVRSNDTNASICFQDGAESVNVITSFNLSLYKRKTKSQYTASVAIQSLFPGGEQTKDPCVIIGNELISAPWECTIAGSDWSGHSMVLRITSEQTFSLILRPDCIPVFKELHEDYSSLLDKTQVSALIALLKDDMKRQSSTTKQVEDCINKIIAFQQQRSSDESAPFLLRFSLVMDAVGEDERVAIKRAHTELGNSQVSVQEIVILKLLQFAGIKEKTQLWSATAAGQSEQSTENLPAFLTSTRYYFEKLQVGPFQTLMTCNPATKLPLELQDLKTALEIPAGFPPLMENANVQFREFLRTGISYKALVSLGRDARTHYLKEIGSQSASLLGSLHLLGNISSLQEEIADGLADLKQTGDYIGFVKHVRGGLAESYYKFADSWSATINQSAAARRESSSSSTDSVAVGDNSSSPMKSVRSVVESLTSLILSPSRDASLGKQQISNPPTASPSGSPRTQETSRRLLPIDYEDPDSSGSEESSLSCIQSLDGWEMVSRDVQRRQKGQEFLRRLQVSLCGEENKDERFVSCLKLRHLNPDDKLNALVTNHSLYFMKVGSPSADHVVLTIKLLHLYKARHRDQDNEHYLQLLMKISGGRRLSLPSPNPADSPLVRCDSVKVAQKAANIINQTKRNSEDNTFR